MSTTVLIHIPKNARCFSPRIGSTTIWLLENEMTVVAQHLQSGFYSFTAQDIHNVPTVYHVYESDVEVINA